MARKKPIISPLGQWAYPGEVTIIPSSNITMKGVNYPVLGIDDLGNQQMMMPGQDYTFPGDYVTEIPQMGKGGLRQWFDEKWVDVKTGKACGRSGKDKDGRPYPACRPSKRVNETTPKTTSEMSSLEKAKFKREKTSGKRIDYNHKRRQDGGEWLDDEPEVNPKIGWNSGNRYSYDKKGNLIYTNHPLSFDYDVEQFIEHAINNKSGWLGNSLNDYEIDFLKNAKNKIQNLDVWPTSLEFQVQTQVDKLNPSLDELINVTQNIYPDQYAIDNSFSKASKSRIDLPTSAFENDIKERYVIPEILKNSINKRFGTLPTTRDDSYSPNRIWTTKVKNDEDSNVGARFATDEDNSKYAYILTPNSKKASDLSKEKINTKKENIENLLSSADNKFYENLYLKYPDYIQYPGNYNNPEIGLFGDIKNILPNQMWNRAEQMRVEMLNNPEIKDWADLHNVNLSRGNEDSKQNLVIDGFAPKVPESAYANRLVKAGLPVSTPDYSYGADDTYIVQDPSKFNLAGYFPIPKDYDEENAKQLIAKKLGIKPEQLNNKDYLIHYNKSPITEYTPGKKYGGWLEEYQVGGVRRPIYTSNPRDPRIGSYRDSLNLYNSGEDYYSRLKKSSFDSPNIGVSEEDLKKARDENYKKYPWDKLKMPVSNEKSGKKFQPVSKYNIYVSDVGNIESNRYKKPVQPYIYKKPEVSPIYTSDLNDPRLRSYNDSLSLYNKGKSYLNQPYSNNLYNYAQDLLQFGDSRKIAPGKSKKGISDLMIPQYKKPVQPYIYKKPEVIPEVIETPVAPAPVVEPPKPSLFVSNIDRDMYTPGGGMAREYNIGVRLQDGNRKSFRTEKEFQDWKAANNLDISKAKVTEGRGYSYDYPENKKYGGWLNKYQPGGGWAGWTPNVGKPYMRTSPAGNAGYSDNTRVVNQNTNVSAANRKAAEAAEYAKRVGSISQGETKSAYEKAREASSFVSQAERRKGSADPLDYVLDIFNPAAIGFAGVDLSNNLGSAASNTVQGNFAEAGSDLLGAGLNALSIIPAAAEFKGIVKPLSKFARLTPAQYRAAQQFANNSERAISQAVSYASKLAQSQINKNPRLALSLQRGRPISLDNVNTVSGIRYGDVSSVPNFNKIKPNTISEGAFFKQLEKGAGSLDNSLKKRVADLESEEGFRRLVDQEKDYLFYNSDLEEGALERVAKINARARIDELKNTRNINKEAAEFASTNFLNAGIPNRFVETSQLYDNAFRGAGYDDVLSNMLSKRQGINLVKATPNYSKSVPGEIGIGYNYVGNVPTEMHEIAHALQRGRRLSVDDQLRNIVPKKELTRDQKHAYDYFRKGSHRQEPSAFANELRESMLQSGIIPDYYSPISQQQIQDAYKYFKTKPMGTYNKNTGNFLSSTRILDFMAPNQSNSKLLSDILNKLPAVSPLAVGAAAASQLPEQKNGGWLNKYK